MKIRSKEFLCFSNCAFLCDDARNAQSIIKTLNPDIFFVDPPYNEIGLYDCIPLAQPGKYLAVSWGYRSFSAACCAAERKGWEPMFELVWDCVTSWYTPSNPLARHRSVGVYGKVNSFDLEKALIEQYNPVNAMQCDMFGGESNPYSRTVRNTRGTYKFTPSGKHLSTIYQYPNTQMKRSGYSHGKPVQWISAMLSGLSGDVVLDFFGGTGTVAESCAIIGKKCITIEIDPAKMSKIIDRVSCVSF